MADKETDFTYRRGKERFAKSNNSYKCFQSYEDAINYRTTLMSEKKAYFTEQLEKIELAEKRDYEHLKAVEYVEL